MLNKQISVIGGDSRQIYATEYLAEHGFRIKTFACEHGKIPENIKIADCISDAFDSTYILLPLPVTKNGKTLNTPLSSASINLKDVIEATNENNRIFIGMCPNNLYKLLSAKANRVTDYFRIEELTEKNALLTAEGILGIVLEKLPVSVFGLNTAILGYGRIGTYLGRILSSLGSDVTIFARNHLQLTKAELCGYKTYNLNKLEHNIENFDCIINTVPYPVINENALKKINKNCILIESASEPYGVDFTLCEKYDVNLIKAFSLPGKKNPKSAGLVIGKIIKEIITGDDNSEKQS